MASWAVLLDLSILTGDRVGPPQQFSQQTHSRWNAGDSAGSGGRVTRCSGLGENRICWVDEPARWSDGCEARAAVSVTAREVGDRDPAE